MSSSRGSSDLGVKPTSPVSLALVGRFCIIRPPGNLGGVLFFVFPFSGGVGQEVCIGFGFII